MPNPTRRVVIAQDGGAGAASHQSIDLEPAVQLATTTVHEICEVTATGDIADRVVPWHHDPEPDGAILRIVTLAGARPGDQAKALHASPTVDVGVIVSGGVTLVLPRGQETTLGAGDSFVLHAVEHAWRNDSPEPCVLAVTLLKPSGWAGAAAT